MWEGGSVIQGLDDHRRRSGGTHHPHPPFRDRHTVCEKKRSTLKSREVRLWYRVRTETLTVKKILILSYKYRLCLIHVWIKIRNLLWKSIFWIYISVYYNYIISYNNYILYSIIFSCISLCCRYNDRETLMHDRSYDHIDQYHRKPSLKVEDRRVQTVKVNN